MSDAVTTPSSAAPSARRSWSAPILAELPKLTKLTLASAIGGGGGTGGGGSTVFGFLAASLLAASALAGCSADRGVEPSAGDGVTPIAAISCVGDLKTQKISCGGPSAAPGTVIIGGQGSRVALRATNVSFLSFDPDQGDLTFMVSVQNLTSQILGSDGIFPPNGIKVFFETPPNSSVGTITVMGASNGSFTAGSQDYYNYPGTLDPYQTSVSQGWQFHFAGLAGGDATFTFTVMVAAQVFDQSGPLSWSPIQGTTQVPYSDVAASSSTDRMAVGDNGNSAHYAGGVWTTLPLLAAGEPFGAVTAIAPGEYIAVSRWGGVFHFKNNVWTTLYRRGSISYFTAVWAKDPTHIVAVGNGGIISRINGGSWGDQDAPIGASDFLAVSGNASGTLVSAITAGFAASQVWTSLAGGPFAPDPALPPVNESCSDIAFDTAGHWMAGCYDSTSLEGYVFSSTGDTLWKNFQVVPQALTPIGPDSVAIGWLETLSFGYGIDIAGYGIGHGAPSSVALGLPADPLQLVAAAPAGAGFLFVGDNEHLYQWASGTTTDLQGTGAWSDPDLWGIGDTLWALNGNGGFYKLVNGAMTQLTGAAGLTRFWGSSADSFFAITQTAVYTSHGSGAWTQDLTAPVGNLYFDIWADPTGNTVIVLDQGGIVQIRYGGFWSPYNLPESVSAVWGCDANTAWVATPSGNIYKFDSGVMTKEVDPPFTVNFHSMTGTSCTDVWAGADNGDLWHLQGASWGPRDQPGGFSYLALAPRTTGEVIALGTQGKGAMVTISPVAQWALPTQGQDVRSMWRLANGEVYVAGFQFLLRGTQ